MFSVQRAELLFAVRQSWTGNDVTIPYEERGVLLSVRLGASSAARFQPLSSVHSLCRSPAARHDQNIGGRARPREFRGGLFF